MSTVLCRRETPVLFVTSFWKTRRDFEAVTKALGSSIQFLRKPVQAVEVAHCVNVALGLVQKAPPAPSETA